jgi:phosphoglycolate phosphatase-like HAD superfamily hydrolase
MTSQTRTADIDRTTRETRIRGRLALQRLGVQRAWMVGDMPDDLAAARAAGVVPLGVCAPGDATDPVSARRTAGRLVAAGAARILSDLSDLEDLLP